jgi:hypothetical protein
MYLSCVLMALVYIHNTITWIQTWKQCVVFLQQTMCGVLTANSVWCSSSKQCVVFLQQTVWCSYSKQCVWCSSSKQCVVFFQQTVCGVLPANTDFKIYTSRCSFITGADNYHTQTKNYNEMPSNCFTMYIFYTDHIFCICQILEKKWEYNEAVHQLL